MIGKYFILSEIAHDEEALAAMPPVTRHALLRQEVIAVQVLLSGDRRHRGRASRSPRC
ncbi:hypothetical protein AB5I41_27620 [Sphingomonas sp. MMS24-JH45]